MKEKALQDLHYYELDKHVKVQDFKEIESLWKKGIAVGIISEAGCPAIADPGAELVNLAHSLQVEVIPLVGPSSIILGLMASGMNGQQFIFHGYLSNKKEELIRQIRQIETQSQETSYTQIFIETPYRNRQILEALRATCKPNTLLALCVGLTSDDQKIIRKHIADWKKVDLAPFHKKPAIFLLSTSR